FLHVAASPYSPGVRRGYCHPTGLIGPSLPVSYLPFEVWKSFTLFPPRCMALLQSFYPRQIPGNVGNFSQTLLRPLQADSAGETKRTGLGTENGFKKWRLSELCCSRAAVRRLCQSA
ncbi:hypothetical protein KUCAC02_005476, partial [Chaenocephalus aceratus]